MVRDTVNRFEIGVPIGWRYGVPINRSVAFMAVREAQNEQDFLSVARIPSKTTFPS